MKLNNDGIYWVKGRDRWRVSVCRNQIRYGGGEYKDLKKAKKAREALEKILPPKTCKDRIQNGRTRNTDRYKKEACEKCGETKELYLHHILPLNWGGGFEEENCITLCKKCHLETHKLLSKKLTLDLRNKILSKHREEILEILNN